MCYCSVPADRWSVGFGLTSRASVQDACTKAPETGKVAEVEIRLSFAGALFGEGTNLAGVHAYEYHSRPPLPLGSGPEGLLDN